jgi:glycosyltransferase involved in cell wall biosynthesis
MSIAIVIPSFNTQQSLTRVLSEVPSTLADAVIIVDDGSAVPLVADGYEIIRHRENKGYGAAQKTGYDAALKRGADRILLLHGDGQYNTEDVLGLTDPLAACDAAIGSRFLNMGANQIPLWRRLGNRTLTIMANLRFGTNVSELHSGARGFRADTLRRLNYHRFSDDYIFDHQVLASLLDQGASIGEKKVRCAYDDTVQSIAVGPSIRYALGVVRTIVSPPPRPSEKP